MKILSQKEIFLRSEADSFYQRNIERLKKNDYLKHELILQLKKIINNKNILNNRKDFNV